MSKKERFLCPRRGEMGIELPKGWPKDDHWIGKEGDRTCSWCGSLHPDDFMAAVLNGEELGPTDKTYKVYVNGAGGGKFYFQHLAEPQRRAFVDLYNDRNRRRYDDDMSFTIAKEGSSAMAVGYPGYFYQLPFFMGPAT